MRKKILMITTSVMLLTGGVVYAVNQNASDCPLAGTPDCPLIENCPDKGTDDCKLVKSCCLKK